MKLSRYNFTYAFPNGVYAAYNSFSNALALINKTEYEFLNEPGILSTDNLTNKTIDSLRAGSFIIDDQVNELELIRERLLRSRYNTTSLGLTIAPTLNCNFRCTYCYEKGCKKSGIMSDTTQKSIIDFVKHYSKTIDYLDVTWYGGEPLLAMATIEILSAAFKEICFDNGIHYSSSIVTNGYLLTQEIVARLVNCSIAHCQVTIDGTREQHNTRRPHVTGVDTYDTILENVCTASTNFPVGVRVNLDKNNKNAIYSVRDTLIKMGASNVTVYPAPIRSSNDCYNEDACFKTPDFLVCECEYYESLDTLESSMLKYPRLQSNACCADSLNAYVISPNGNLYKCWSDIGIDNLCIGNINTGIIDLAQSIRYLKYDPTRDVHCQECKFMPICIGGCPRDVIDRPDDRCPYTEELHKKYLERIILLTNMEELETNEV